MGTFIATTIQGRRDHFQIQRPGEFLNSFDANAISFLDQIRAVLLQQTGDPTATRHLPRRRSRACGSGERRDCLF
jgi:hypothetical protein